MWRFAVTRGKALHAVVYRHNSLIRRRLGDVDMLLQENKAVNLSLAAPRVNGVLIRPGEVFSFWRLVGNCTAKKGYRQGLTISGGAVGADVGGGMCQFTNLLHWMFLHSPLDVVELHHHNRLDLFPDFGRQVPFGCGTSILYNYLDYRVKNNTGNTFQILVSISDTHLCGELRALYPPELSYHIVEEEKRFVKAGESWRRRNKVYRQTVDKATGLTVEKRLIVESDAEVMYSEEFIPKELVAAI
jgi:vancomycin resistance protein VanW